VSIPPTIVNGIATCPDGYALSPDKTECLPITPPIKIDAPQLADTELDPSLWAQAVVNGVEGTDWLTRVIVGLVSIPLKIAGKIVAYGFGKFDELLALMADLFANAQAQRQPGFYYLAAALMGDLLGIEVDREKLWQEFKAGGRIGSMRELGSSLFNALASEAAGTPQPTAGSAFKITPGDGVGGLPSHQFAPGDGVKAASGILGFATSFAIREGNTDALADLPIFNRLGVFEIFKDFAEDFSKSLGLGRLLRVALRPLMQIMVADPLQADLNTQYRPKLLGASEAIKAFRMAALTQTDLDAELAMLGYSAPRQVALKAQVDKGLSLHQLATLRAHGDLNDADFAVELERLDHDPARSAQIIKALDLDPARRLSLTYLEHYVLQFLEGHLSSQAITSLLDGIDASGKFLLTPGEILGVRNLIRLTSTSALRPRHLSPATLQLAYIDGSITLDEYEAHLTALGYSADDVTVLTLETLIKAKDKAATAAAKAAKGKTATPKPASAASPAPTPAPTATP
jgi:hypothetical protein